jgi:hypothetical protein
MVWSILENVYYYTKSFSITRETNERMSAEKEAEGKLSEIDEKVVSLLE